MDRPSAAQRYYDGIGQDSSDIFLLERIHAIIKQP